MSPQIWTDNDKLKMREASEWHMIDEGYRLVRSVAIDGVGDDIETWTQASIPTICGLEMHEGKENKNDFAVTIYDVTLRLPHDYEIDEKDRFLVTKYRNETVNFELELVTPVQYGIANIRVGARKVVL